MDNVLPVNNAQSEERNNKERCLEDSCQMSMCHVGFTWQENREHLLIFSDWSLGKSILPIIIYMFDQPCRCIILIGVDMLCSC